MSFATEFKEFILRGNVVDLAVAVVIGAAFGGVVTPLTRDFLTPLTTIASSGAKGIDFENLSFAAGGGTFHYGDFINVVISFVILALVIFVFVVKPVNWLMDHAKARTPALETTRDCPECLSKIPLAARRCAFCTAEVGLVAASG